MKGHILVMAALAALLVGNTLYAAAADPTAGVAARWDAGEAAEFERDEGRFGGPGRLQRLAEVLALSDGQKVRIETILEEERDNSRPLRQQLREGREQIRMLVEAATFDEAAVRSLAQEQAAVRAELTVVKARTKHRIHAVLDAEQRQLAEKLRSMRGKKGPAGRPGPRH